MGCRFKNFLELFRLPEQYKSCVFVCVSFFCLFSSVYSIAQDVRINEIVASNDGDFLDEDSDASDWIELYNPSDLSISLEGYSISDNWDDPDQWVFPSITMPAQTYMVVFCSGKNRFSEPLHTNFKIKSEGEPLLLRNGAGELIDVIEPRAMAEGFSLTRICPGTCYWELLSEQSPNNINAAVSLVSFSEPSGIYMGELNLELSHSFNHEIRYTLDGSVPEENDLLYTDAINLVDPTGTLSDISSISTSPYWSFPSGEMPQVNVVRARSFLNGEPSSTTFSKTYGFDSFVDQSFQNYPVFSIHSNADSLFDPQYGIHVPGDTYDSTNPQWTGNYFQRGGEWERDVHIEYFEEGDLKWSQDIGVRIHGGKSRNAAQKSLRLYAREDLGAAKFNSPFFETKSKTVFDKLLLRAHFGCWNRTVIKDEVSAYIARDLDFETQHSRPCIVFINGEYWGLFAIRDYFDSNYIEEDFEIEKDSVDIIVNGSGVRPGQSEEWGIVEGDNWHYIAMIDFLENNDISDPDNYAYLSTQLDISSTLDYYCSQIFFAQKDWPSNNYKLWSGGADSKWRYLFYDIDSGWGQMGATHNTLEYAAHPTGSTIYNTPYATYLFRRLLESPLFVEAFQKRFACLLKSEFSQPVIEQALDRFVDLYTEGMQENLDRWHNVSSMTDWISRVESKLYDFNDERVENVVEHMSTYFNIDFDPADYDCMMIDDPVFVEDDTLTAVTDSITTALEELEISGPKIHIYPNPSKDWIWVDAEINSESARLRILDALGRLVYSDSYYFHQKVSVSDFSPGLYFLVIDSDKRSFTKRFIKP